jgi:hypothetical protein
MTYGHEVRCEDSWGHMLEALLHPDTQVLNFAMGAQGLNQTLLRYEKDVRPWKPQIVIIGVTSAMITRNTNTYPFLKDPEWGMPFARPRFVMQDHVLSASSEPVPDPGSIFGRRAIAEVPNLLDDDYYRRFEWERGGIWRLLERSYLFRFAYSVRPPSDGREEERNLNAMRVGQVVTKRLVEKVLQDGTIPLVVYLPYRDEVGHSVDSQNLPLSARMLQNAGIRYLDPTACLIAEKISDAYMEGSHYSPRGNAQIAGCLEPVLRQMIKEAALPELSGRSIPS